jgi:hypothetical protein
LAAFDQGDDRFENALVGGHEKVIIAQEVGDFLHGTVIDQQCAKQALLGLGVVGQDPIAWCVLVAGLWASGRARIIIGAIMWWWPAFGHIECEILCHEKKLAKAGGPY